MAVPKRKMSRSNTRHRRSQWKAVAPSLVTCERCLRRQAPAARAVRAGAWRRRQGSRRSPGTARRPSTANDGDACCCATSSASGLPLLSPLPGPGTCPAISCPAGESPAGVSLRPAAARVRPAQRGSIGASCACSGIVGQPGATLGAQSRTVVRHSGWNGSASTTASRSSRFEVEQVVLELAGLVVVLVGVVVDVVVDVQLLDRADISSSIGSRHRTHSPSSAACAVPVTSTPSMTASSRRSSSTGEPSGTRRTSMPRSAGAGTDRDTSRWDPGRRPSSRVSSTSGALGSRLFRGSLPVPGTNRSVGNRTRSVHPWPKRARRSRRPLGEARQPAAR